MPQPEARQPTRRQPGTSLGLYRRVWIERVSPAVDAGRHAAKATVGSTVAVSADIFRDGHEQLAAVVSYRGPDDDRWHDQPLTPVGNDHWQGEFAVDRMGLWEFKVAAWTDSLARHPEALDRCESEPYPIWVDRALAGFSAWYEMFPRSEGAVLAHDGQPARSGTLLQAAKRLADIAAMGFDVVYLPPIHPIGHTARKGPNNSLDASPDDPGVPWAIGSAQGGHTAVHPDLGTLDDFDDFVAQAHDVGLVVALDYAVQCSPDHPWVSEHPEWFHHRPDGSIAFAENPPKQYQDIYPLDFDNLHAEEMWEALRDVMQFWIDRGVRIFRVDNPHTKALPFWEWLIDDVHRHAPDVLFLSEAFTRPTVMRALAKLGFSQSYTYFTWRNTKHELTEYMVELAHTDMADYFRPNFWPNTPDILTDYLVQGGRPAFKIRLALAALLSPNYGIYSGYELYENIPRQPGSEEYLHSEKYAYRPRDWGRQDSLAPWITQLNAIRRQEPALQQLRTIWFHHIDNDQLLCFSKTDLGRTHPVLVIVNLDPSSPQEGMTWLDLWHLGFDDGSRMDAHDLLTNTTYSWHGPQNYVRLDPADEPVHVLRLTARD